MLDQLVKGYIFRANPYFNNAPPPGYQNQTPSRFVNCVPSRQYSAGALIAGKAPVTAGAGMPANTFTWLPYIAGWVTWTAAEGTPILTGKMSGCWLARGILNGRPVFMHIGTDNFNQDNNNFVKNAVKIARNSGVLKIVSAFSPIAHVKGGASVFGAQTADNRFLAVACTDIRGGHPNDYKVVQVKVVAGSALPF